MEKLRKGAFMEPGAGVFMLEKKYEAATSANYANFI
jgi:hypothetical protein